MKLTLSLVAAAALAAAMPAQAVNVANQTPQGEYTSNVLGGTTWTTFTAMFDAVHTRSALPDFTSLAGYDAVWVDQELGNALSDAEVASLAGFIGSGHKAVLIGENYAWEAWNASLMAVVGGSRTDDCSWNVGAPMTGGLLTSGIASVQNACGSLLNSGGGAQILFDNSMAAVYKIGSGEALVILDSNWNDDNYIDGYDNYRFGENVIDWLAVPVPEPGTYALMLAGLFAVSSVARRRAS